MTKIVIATRSINEELYGLAAPLINLPHPKVRLVGTGADTYFYELMKLDADWVINIDEDAFVWDSERIERLLRYMEREGYDCCGVPDGGVISHRCHHPVAVNAFFTILNTSRLRDKFDLTSVVYSIEGPDLRPFTPTYLFKGAAYTYDEFEPYYRFFFWMVRSGYKILYLDALQWSRDLNATILLDHEAAPFLIHCWYARAFDEQRPRFKQAYDLCLSLRERVKRGEQIRLNASRG